MTRARTHQQQVLLFRRGRMGVAAVPGSGKTWTLSQLAADLLLEGRLGPDQEVLVVTLVNSAVENFYRRMQARLEQTSALGYLGYRVRTLHGLSHDIVRERPRLAGLGEDFQIADEKESDELRQQAASAWLRAHPAALDDFLNPDLDEGRLSWVRREHPPELVNTITRNLIRLAKDRELTPALLRERLERTAAPLPLALMACEVYADYQRGLAYRGRVDFDDLVRLALRAVRSDPDYLERLRARWPYILEDEAQDSSRLQEQLLRLLAGERGHWVRVGDPNQAIFETFTTASPGYLLSFLEEPGVARRNLPESGRSQPVLMDLANFLVEWTRTEHPVEWAREALSPAVILPAPADDPRPNPPANPDGLRLIERGYGPQAEVDAVANSLARWLPDHPDETVAVLVPRNTRGAELVQALLERGLPVVDSLLQSTAHTRQTAGALAIALGALAEPLSADRLSQAYGVWRPPPADPEDAAARRRRAQIMEWLRRHSRPEDFLYPEPGRDWLTGLEAEPELEAELLSFRGLMRRWQGASLLPVDQALLTVAQDLYTERTDLALAHKLALALRREQAGHPDWRLPELAAELQDIARSGGRRFIGFDEDDSGFDPERYRGQVVVGTLHKAKGLEWDRVYLMSVNNYDFPSGMEYDRYIAEKWFVRRGLNLEAEAAAQLAAADGRVLYAEGAATLEARLDYVRERLRLLYVALTRARRELIITWNTGREGDCQPALPLQALIGYWKKVRDESAG